MRCAVTLHWCSLDGEHYDAVEIVGSSLEALQEEAKRLIQEKGWDEDQCFSTDYEERGE